MVYGILLRAKPASSIIVFVYTIENLNRMKLFKRVGAYLGDVLSAFFGLFQKEEFWHELITKAIVPAMIGLIVFVYFKSTHEKELEIFKANTDKELKMYDVMIGKEVLLQKESHAFTMKKLDSLHKQELQKLNFQHKERMSEINNLYAINSDITRSNIEKIAETWEFVNSINSVGEDIQITSTGYHELDNLKNGLMPDHVLLVQIYNISHRGIFKTRPVKFSMEEKEKIKRMVESIEPVDFIYMNNFFEKKIDLDINENPKLRRLKEAYLSKRNEYLDKYYYATISSSYKELLEQHDEARRILNKNAFWLGKDRYNEIRRFIDFQKNYIINRPLANIGSDQIYELDKELSTKRKDIFDLQDKLLNIIKYTN